MPADIASAEGVAEFRQAYNDTFEAVDFIYANIFMILLEQKNRTLSKYPIFYYLLLECS
ncbi:hypothetical protein SAMN05421785_103305 [Chryseobacterium gambrini]|uniref:Uncharacterized protein n=1 Tax=Chryseobacterium gambrini TaxID=373672 RepID=A0A1N7MKS3_9FLAO|nr:hypothetical protein SAMN05421785_103305 [Chryseobacterium gambrini]